MKTIIATFFLLIGTFESSFSQVLIPKLVKGACSCFSEASGPEELSDHCFQKNLNETINLLAQEDFELLVKELENYDINLFAIDSTSYSSAFQLGENFWRDLKPLFYERLTFECDPFYNMLSSFRKKNPLLDDLQYDSAYALNYIPIQTELIENELGSTQTFTKRGVLYLVLGKKEEAISDFHKAFEIDTANIDPITFLGFLALESSDYKKAEGYFNQGYQLTQSNIFLSLKYYSKRKASEN